MQAVKFSEPTAIYTADALRRRYTEDYPHATVKVIPAFKRHITPTCTLFTGPRVRVQNKHVCTFSTHEFTYNTHTVTTPDSQSTRHPLYCIFCGASNDDRARIYWNARGVNGRTRHHRTPRLIPCYPDNAVVRLTKGAVINNGRHTWVYVGKQDMPWIRLHGPYDCTYRAVKLVKATFSSCSVPVGYLGYTGQLFEPLLTEVLKSVNTGKVIGDGTYSPP